MTKQIDNLLEELEKKALDIELAEEITELQKEVISLRKTLESYGIREEMHVTNIEFICQKELDNLKKRAMGGGLSSDEAKVFDLLHKNLRMVRGKIKKKDLPSKETTEKELLRIVDETK